MAVSVSGEPEEACVSAEDLDDSSPEADQALSLRSVTAGNGEAVESSSRLAYQQEAEHLAVSSTSTTDQPPQNVLPPSKPDDTVPDNSTTDGIVPKELEGNLSVAAKTDDSALLAELDGILTDDVGTSGLNQSCSTVPASTSVSPRSLQQQLRRRSPFSDPFLGNNKKDQENDTLVTIDLNASGNSADLESPVVNGCALNAVPIDDPHLQDDEDSASNCHKITTATANLDKIARLYEKYSVQCTELERIDKQNSDYREQLLKALRDKEALEQKLKDSTQETSTKTLELERKVLEYEYQLKAAKDRMAAQEAHFKKAAADYQHKNASTMEQLKKSAERAQREKDESVIKYAKRESELLTLTKTKQQLEEKLKEVTIARDALQSNLRGQKNEKYSVQQNLDQKAEEIENLVKEAESAKNFVKEADIRVKLANQRADEAEKKRDEVVKEHETIMKRWAEAKEESQLSRTDYQRLIGRFQESQDKQSEVIQIARQEQGDQEEIYKTVVSELDQLKRQHKSTLKETEELSSRVTSLVAKCDTLEKELNRERCERQLEAVEIVRLKTIEEIVESERETAAACRRRADAAVEDRQQAETEAAECRTQAERMLQLTEQLSVRNSQLEGERTAMLANVALVEGRFSELESRYSDQCQHVTALEQELDQLKACSSAEIDSLSARLAEYVKREQELTTNVADERNENNVLRRKHAASLKELRSELTIMRRRLQTYENNGSGPNGSDGGHTGTEGASSRASSVTSLEQNQQALNGAESTLTEGKNNIRSDAILDEVAPTSSTNIANNYGQVMIEKIVKLQRQLARRTEKIEFLQEHVKQLGEELQKKSRIIQMYVLREQSGVLSPPNIELNQVAGDSGERLLKQHGQLHSGALLSSTHPSSLITGMFTGGGQQPTDLSVEINGKLQAVLEDTLCKNITLQESMDTLSLEIARLTGENRQLKLNREGTEDDM